MMLVLQEAPLVTESMPFHAVSCHMYEADNDLREYTLPNGVLAKTPLVRGTWAH